MARAARNISPTPTAKTSLNLVQQQRTALAQVRNALSLVVAEHDRLVVYPLNSQGEAALKLAQAGAQRISEDAAPDADVGELPPKQNS